MKTFLLSVALLFALASTAQISNTQRHLYSDTVYLFINGNGTLQKDVLEIARLGSANDSAQFYDVYDTTTDHHFIIKIDSSSNTYYRHIDGYAKPFYLYTYRAALAGYGPIVFTALFYPEPSHLIHSISFGTPEHYVNFKLKYSSEELKVGRLLPNSKPKR